MTGRYPRYSLEHLEAVATRLLREHFDAGIRIPVDIDYLLECQPGVSLDFARDLRSRFGVAGAVLAHPGEERFTILIDQAVGDGLASFYRFTVAEELAHLVLHRSILAQVQCLEDAIVLHESPDYYPRLDRNAKRLASALLMPADHLRQHAKELFAALCAGGIPPDIIDRMTLRLAQKYNVSGRAMGYRLEGWPLNTYAAVGQAMTAGLLELP